MQPKPDFSSSKLLAYSPRRRALASVLYSLVACGGALVARHAQLANEPLYAIAACALGCGMCTFVALEAAKLSGQRWTYAAVAPAFAVVVAADAVTASLLRVFPPARLAAVRAAGTPRGDRYE